MNKNDNTIVSEARGTVNIKIVGDYIRAQDSIADGIANPPKKS